MSRKLSIFIAATLALCLVSMPLLHAQISPGGGGNFVTLNVSGPATVNGVLTASGGIAATAPVTIGGVPVYPGHALIGVQTFCTTGCSSPSGSTYTPDTGTNQVVVEVQASGGGTGGCSATAAGQICVTGGAGAGSYARALITSGFSGVTVTATVGGAGGAAGANTGTAGPTASFGVLVACPGGPPLSAGPAQTAPANWTAVSGAGGVPGACALSGATLIYTTVGGGGNPAFSSGSVGNQTQSGAGGKSFLGNPSPGLITSAATAGSTGQGYGAGGTGAVAIASQAAVAGGTGGPGIVIVYEYN
jgi:hypothetical protein